MRAKAARKASAASVCVCAYTSMRTSVPMWGSTASKRWSDAAEQSRGRRNASVRAPLAWTGQEAHPTLLLVMFEAAVPVAVHLFRGGNLHGTHEAEAEPLRIGHVPDA